MAEETNILSELNEGSDRLKPLILNNLYERPVARDGGYDAEIDLRWGEQSWRFIVEVKQSATPKQLRMALDQLRRYSETSGLPGLIVVPFLGEKQLEIILNEGLSGVDLCGNAVVQVPGELLVYRTGQPNRYPASVPIRNIYQGTSSMVARVYLLRPAFESVGGVREEIQQRGGRIAMSTVSKVLKALEEDLVIRRDGAKSRLLQPEDLLEKLAANFQPPDDAATSQGFQWRGEPDRCEQRLGEIADDQNIAYVASGAASTPWYSSVPREGTPGFYCENLKKLLAAAGDLIEPVDRFADAKLIQCDDPLVYFDARETPGGKSASPVQCWLELQAGDKRQKEIAQQVREQLLAEISRLGDPL